MRARLRPGGRLAFKHAGEHVLMLPGDEQNVPLDVWRAHHDRLEVLEGDPASAWRVRPHLTLHESLARSFPHPTDTVHVTAREESLPVACVMLTNTARPAGIPQRTLRGLQAAGVSPSVVTSSSPPSPAEQRRAAFRALLIAYHQNRALLFLEDDLFVDASTFRASIRLALYTEGIACLYLAARFTPPGIQRLLDAGAPIPHHAARIPLHLNPNREALVRGRKDALQGFDCWVGSQAVLLPFGVVKTLVERDDYWLGRQTSFDVHLRATALAALQTGSGREWLPYVVVPNPVQHAAPPNLSTRGRRQTHQSGTFAHPTPTPEGRQRVLN